MVPGLLQAEAWLIMGLVSLSPLTVNITSNPTLVFKDKEDETVEVTVIKYTAKYYYRYRGTELWVEQLFSVGTMGEGYYKTIRSSPQSGTFYDYTPFAITVARRNYYCSFSDGTATSGAESAVISTTLALGYEPRFPGTPPRISGWALNPMPVRIVMTGWRVPGSCTGSFTEFVDPYNEFAPRYGYKTFQLAFANTEVSRITIEPPRL